MFCSSHSWFWRLSPVFVEVAFFCCSHFTGGKRFYVAVGCFDKNCHQITTFIGLTKSQVAQRIVWLRVGNANDGFVIKNVFDFFRGNLVSWFNKMLLSIEACSIDCGFKYAFLDSTIQLRPNFKAKPAYHMKCGLFCAINVLRTFPNKAIRCSAKVSAAWYVGILSFFAMAKISRRFL